MKDRLNFWLTVLVMIVAGLWVYNINGWGATPTYNGGTWYSYYYGTPAKSSSGTLLDVDVFPPATGNIEYEYRRQSSKLITTYLDATYTCNGTQTTDQSSCDRDMSDFASDKYFGNVPENIEHLKVERTGREATVEMRNIKLKLKKHIRLENSTTVGTTNLTIDNTSETYYFGQEYEFTIPIRSFLADGNFTISLESGSDASFYLPTTSIALAQSGTNICAIRNSSTNDPRTSGGAASTLYNASYCDITVKYRPMSTTEEKCTVKVQVGTSVAYAIIKAKGTNIASFGTVENYKVSAEKELLPAYRASSSSNVTVTINSQGQHYQIYNGSSWINGNSTITLTSDQKFKIRFAPTDAWGEADGTGTGNAKSANIVVQQGSNSYSMPITGTPKVATTTLSPLNISLQNLTTHSSNPTISLDNNFKITVTNQRGTGDPYNTATEKNKITLVSQDEDVVKAVKNSDNTSYTIQILGGGETTIVATLPAYAEHHTTSNCTIAVKVEKIQQTISWTSCPTSPVDVFSEHDLLATVGYTAGTVSAITYTVNPSDAATVANGKIKITKRYETFTVTARTSETATYKSASSQKTISVNKVYPIIVWASSSPELSATHRVGDDAFQLSATIQQSASVKVKYVSSNTSIATVDADGKMTCVAPGLVKITATYDGDDNFKACPDANKISYLFVVSPANFGIVAILSNETVPFLISTGESGTFDITSTAAANFFVSSSSTTGWSNTNLSNIADGTTIYFKFQPNCTTAVNKDFIITHNSKTYTVNMAGTGAKNLLAFGTVDIPYSTNSDWYSLSESFFNASSDTYSITITDNDNTSSNNKTIMVQTQGEFFRRTISEAQRSTNQFRVGFYPKNETPVSYTITITDSHFNIAYPLTVTGTGDEKVYENFPAVAVGTATDDDYDFAIYMRYFDASGDITVIAPDHLLLRRGTKTSDNPETWQWSDTWIDTLKNIGMRENIKVRFAPESKIASSYTAYVIIHDNNEAGNAENYRYGFVIPAIDDNVYAFTDNTPVMCISAETKTHTLSNFIPAGDLTVNATGTNFLVSKTGADNTYSSTLTIGASEAKVFYIKFAPISATSANDYITITDVTTKRTYQIKCTGTPGTTTFANTNIGQASTETLFQYESYFGTGTTVEITSSNPTVFRAFPEGQESSTNTAISTGNKFSISSGKFGVKFYPEATGEVTGTITITSTTDPTKTVSIPVEGTGVQQSITFGSESATIARGTIQSQTIQLTNMVSSAGYTISSNGNSYIVTQPQNGTFTVTFLPQGTTHYVNYSVTIHDNAFSTTDHDYKITVNGYASAVETQNFGSVDARSTSSTTKQITLSGVANIPGLMISSDEITSYLIDNNAAAFAPTDGTHTVTFTPFHQGTYNNKSVYLYITDANNSIIKYPLLNCNGSGNQVDLTNYIQWVTTTIETQENSTGMAIINNATYSPYVRLKYSVTSGSFYDSENHPEGLEISPYEIFAPVAGNSNVKATVDVIDGSTDFVGESTEQITATDKKVQKISYSNNIYYVTKDGDVSVQVYAYDSKNTSTHLPATFAITCSDGKVTATENTSAYDVSTYTHTFTIHGNTVGQTTVTITATPPAGSLYETATTSGIPVTVLVNGDNCASQSVLSNPSDNKLETSGAGDSKTFQLTGAPCRSLSIQFDYSFGSPTLTVNDGLHSNPIISFSKTGELGSDTHDETFDYDASAKLKPTQLQVSAVSTAVLKDWEGDKIFTILKFSQLSYFDVISNHPNNATIPFGNVTVGMESAVNETIQIDYSALHKAIELSLTDETNFTIVNKSQILGLITSCSQFDKCNVIIKYNPKTVGTHTATLKIKGYTTNANDQEEIKEYTYTLTGTGDKRNQVITWETLSQYSIIELEAGRKLTLNASSNQYQYGTSTPIPVTYTLTPSSVATLDEETGVLTVATAGTVTVTAHAAGDEYTNPATDQPLNIEFKLEPQKVQWDYTNFSGTLTNNTKNITTAFGTTTGIPLDAKLYDNHLNPLDFDVQYIVTTESGNSCTTDLLIRVEKNTSDGKFYAYYNNNGVGTAKIRATREGDDTYSKVEPDDEKIAYIVISKATPMVTYSASELQDIYLGDEVTLSRPSSNIDNTTYTEFSYVSGTTPACSTAASDYVTLTKNSDKTTTLKAVRATEPNYIYIRADQLASICFNDAASSSEVAFQVKKPNLTIEWDQNLDLYTGQYAAGGATYSLTARAKDTHNNEYPSNLTITYDLVISDKGCSTVPDNQIAEIIDGVLHVYGTTSATLTITASQDGKTTEGYSNYKPVTSEPKEFVINKLKPTVVITGPATPQAYGAGILTLTASSTGSNYSSAEDANATYTFRVSEGTAAHIANTNELHIDDVGTVKVRAKQTANCIVAESDESDEYVITIEKAERILTCSTSNPSTITYGDNTQSITATSTQSLEEAEITYTIVSGSEYATIDYSTGTITPLKAGNVQVKASIPETQHYNSKDCYCDVTIERASRTITINEDLTNVSNICGTFSLSTTVTDGGGTISFTSDDAASPAVSFSDGAMNVPYTTATRTFIVTATIAQDDQYVEALTTKPCTIGVTSLSIRWKEDADFDHFNTATHDFDLKTLVTSNYEGHAPTVSYSFGTNSESVSGMSSISSSGKMCLYKVGTMNLTANVSVDGISSPASDISQALTVGIGTLIFDPQEDSDSKWTTKENWAPHRDRIPDATNFNVQINDYCFIGKDVGTVSSESDFLSHRVDAACNDLTIDGTNAKLVIGEASTLKVGGTFTNNDDSKFYLTANKWGQASVVFNSGSPKATVEMFFPAGNGSKSNPIWQYRGIAVSGFSPITSVAIDNTTTVNPWASVKIFRWDESQNGSTDNGCWVGEMSGSSVTTNSLLPWNGYAFANMSKDAIWLSYTGTLVNSTHEYTLSKTDTKRSDGTLYANNGVNLLTNSFAAPMTIGKGDYGNANATVTFFNAGTYYDWNDHKNDSIIDGHGDAGQRTVCPKYTTGTAQNTYTIPSGQSFFVTAKKNGDKVTFNYSDIITDLAPSGMMFMPRQNDEPEYNVLGIRVYGKNKGDRLVLLECDSCSRQYDNGYDGYKTIDATDTFPHIYAYNKFGITAVNADSTFNKQYIGFTAGSDDETYTISFETDRLFGYNSLYLTDRKLNQTVDILAGETYQFQGYTVGENMRFQINGVTEEEWENNEDENEDENDGSECDLRVIGNTLYVEELTTYGYQATNIEIYDMTGNRVWSTPLTSARVYDLPTLPQSIYVIRVGDCFVKYR